MEENKWTLSTTSLARHDLEEIYTYISLCLDAPGAADDLMDKFENAFAQVCLYPRSFPQADDPMLRKRGYRKMTIDNFVGAYLIREKRGKWS